MEDKVSKIEFHGTTICAVRRNGEVCIGGDGQVTMGEHTIMKSSAKKVRKIFTLNVKKNYI